MAAELRSSSVGRTLVLEIADPEHRNALGPDIYAAGIEALNAADGNPEIGCVVITGHGGVFSAGGNLQRLLNNRQQPPEVQARSIDGLHTWIEAIRAFPKPVIAAVEGAAAGAGFSLALACDFIVASQEAVFVMAYSTVALSPDGGGSWALGRQLPRALASELLMLGERIGARRLHELGLVSRVCEPGEALAGALELAQRLNARAPNALASAKELLNEAVLHDLSSHLAIEREHFVKNLHHPNAGIGIDAFLQKKPARYV